MYEKWNFLIRQTVKDMLQKYILTVCSERDFQEINAALNYGYGILLSNFNKEIVADGYLTQLGIKHINEYNLTNAIQIYLDKIFDAIEHESFDTSILYEFA